MRIIVLILLLSLASNSWAAVALLSHQNCNSGTSCTTAAMDTTGASVLIVALAEFANITPLLTDSAGNSWTQLPICGFGNFDRNITIFYVVHPNTSASHTFTCDESSENGLNCFATAWSGTITTGSDDGHNCHTTGSGTTIQPGSVSPLRDGALVFTAVESNTSTTWAIDSGFAVLDSNQFSADAADGYLIQTSAASINPTWTLSANSKKPAVIVAFSPPVPPTRLLTTSPGTGSVTSSPGTGVINFK